MTFVPESVRLAPLFVAAFVAAAFLAYVLTPIARAIAVKRGFVDGAPAPVDGPDYQDAKGAWILETFDRLGIRRPKPSAARRQEVGT